MGTLSMWSGAILWFGFLLQVGLLMALIRRGLASKVWVFTGLLLFYAARSAVLYGLARHMPRAAYGELYGGLSLADFVLRTALAGELLVSMVRRGRRLPACAAALLIAAGLTAATAYLLPSRSPVPADRATIFTGWLFAALFGIAARLRLRGWARSVVTGLAAAGISGALAECGKSVSAFHRDGQAYVAWSYGNAAVYALTLVYWIVASARYRREAETISEEAGLYARGTIGMERV